MTKTTDSITPLRFLQVLREVCPRVRFHHSPNIKLRMIRSILNLRKWIAEKARPTISCLARAIHNKARSCIVIITFISDLAYIDAEECYGTIVNSLRNIPGLDASGNSVSTGAEASVDRGKFVKQFMMGEMVRESVTLDLGRRRQPQFIDILYDIGCLATKLQTNPRPFLPNKSSRSNVTSPSTPILCFLES